MKTFIKIGAGALAALGFLAFAALPTYAGSSEYGNSNKGRVYKAYLAPTNNSGAHGWATFTLRDKYLDVKINAWGLTKNKQHPQHVHAFSDNRQARCPSWKDDTNHSGLIELSEAVAVHGPSILDLTPFPTANWKGSVAFSQTYYIGDQAKDPVSLVAELHGMKVHGNYEASVPVACGKIVINHDQSDNDRKDKGDHKDSNKHIGNYYDHEHKNKNDQKDDDRKGDREKEDYKNLKVDKHDSDRKDGHKDGQEGKKKESYHDYDKGKSDRDDSRKKAEHRDKTSDYSYSGKGAAEDKDSERNGKWEAQHQGNDTKKANGTLKSAVHFGVDGVKQTSR